MVPARLIERFWSHVQKGDGCWLWQASTNPVGYGQLNRKIYGQSFAHRFSKGLELGRQLTRSEEVSHTCNTPRCVNPTHLTVGTHAENMAHMAASGRSRKGRLNGEKFSVNGVLDERLVRIIKERAAWGETAPELARASGFSRQTIRDVLAGRTWK